MVDRLELLLAKLSGQLIVNVYGPIRSQSYIGICKKCNKDIKSYICVHLNNSEDYHIHLCEDCYKRIFNELSLPAKIC